MAFMATNLVDRVEITIKGSEECQALIRHLEERGIEYSRRYARQEDRRVPAIRVGLLDEVWGYDMIRFYFLPDLPVLKKTT